MGSFLGQVAEARVGDCDHHVCLVSGQPDQTRRVGV